MASATIGAPSVADIQLVLDALAGGFKAQYSNLGINSPSEGSTTLAKKADLARTKIMGDGTSTYPGLQNSYLQRRLGDYLNRRVLASRYDSIFAQDRFIIAELETAILQNLPTGWSFRHPSGLRALDLYLQRLNCNGSSLVPTTPAYTLTLTATTGGAIAPTTTGAEPRVKIALVGIDANSNAADWIESQPNAASTQTALSGKNNAYTLNGLTGNVPTGVTKLRIYRQLDNNAGSSDPFYWDHDVTVVAGVAWSTYAASIKLTKSDQQLRQDWKPGAWNTFQLLPEEAAGYALALSSSPTAGGAQGSLMAFSAQSFMSPSNVCLNPVYTAAATPAYGYLGVGNPQSTGELARWVAGTLTQGVPALSNDYTNAIQGFVGAVNGVQLRTVSALNANASITSVSYSYLDAANPITPQTGTDNAAHTLNSAVDSTVALTITAGRIVLAITSITLSAATTGTFIAEAVVARSI